MISNLAEEKLALASGFSIFSLILGVGITAFGLLHLSWPQSLRWFEGQMSYLYPLFFVIGSCMLAGLSYWMYRRSFFVGAIFVGGIALSTGNLWALLVVIWIFLSSLVLGHKILCSLKIDVDADPFIFSFLLGIGLYGTTVGLAAHFPVNHPGLYGLGLVVPFFLHWTFFSNFLRTQGEKIFVSTGKRKPPVNALEVCIVMVGLLHFIIALMPEKGFDALHVHLFVPGHLALRQEWGFDANTYVWAVMPMLGDWIFAIAYVLAGEISARLLNVGFIFLLGWLVRELVIWASRSKRGAEWAVLIFLSTPLTFTESSSMFVESVWASFVVAATLLILQSCFPPEYGNTWLAMAGVFLGFALGTKAITFVALPVLAVVMIWRYRSWLKNPEKGRLFVGVCLFLGIGCVPYLTAWWLTGNPVFPFFNKLFQSPLYPAVNFESASIFGRGLTWEFVYEATFRSEKYLEAYAGAPGFQWLVFLLFSFSTLLFAGHKKGLVLLGIGIFNVFLTFQAVSYLRYVFPSTVLLIGVIGIALACSIEQNGFLRRVSQAVCSVVVILNLLFFNSALAFGGLEIRSILTQTISSRDPIEVVNLLNYSRTPVGVFTSIGAAGLASDALYPNWYNHSFQDKIFSSDTEESLAEALRDFGVEFIILDENWMFAGSLSKGMLLKKITESVFERNSMSVRLLKGNFQFDTELLQNPDFSSQQGWVIPDNRAHDNFNGVVTVDINFPITQLIHVSPGKRYRNVVVARCEKETSSGRMQVNWLDSESTFISTNIKVFDCNKSWEEFSMEVIAPQQSASAVVYTAGHTEVPVQFRRNSFLQ